jgi:hypothetical protein
MDVGTVFLFLAILAAALAFVGWPLAQPALVAEGPSGRDLRRSELTEEKERLLKNLTDLDLDHKTGKMEDSDFESLSRKLKGDAARVLKELDVNEGKRVKRADSDSPAARESVPPAASASARPSDAVAKTPAPPPPREERASGTAPRFCSKCGWKAKAADDLFCGRCGASLPVD